VNFEADQTDREEIEIDLGLHLVTETVPLQLDLDQGTETVQRLAVRGIGTVQTYWVEGGQFPVQTLAQTRQESSLWKVGHLMV